MVALPIQRSRPARTDASHVLSVAAGREQHRLRAALCQLQDLRAAAIVAQVAVLSAAIGVLGVRLPAMAIVAVLVAFGVFTAWTRLRLREPQPVSDRELAAQLLLDLFALSAVIALSGGAANPFAGTVVLPPALGAAWLSRRCAWAVGLMSMACYSLLAWLAHPLQIPRA